MSGVKRAKPPQLRAESTGSTPQERGTGPGAVASNRRVFRRIAKDGIVKQIVLIALVIVAIGSLTAACGDGIEGDPSSGGATAIPGVGSSNLGGDALPVQLPGEDYGHQPQLLTGTLDLQSNGCWTADLGDGPRLVVFPLGYTKPTDDGSLMLAPDGLTVATGMMFDGTGGIVPASGFPGVPDGYWGGYLDFCNPEAREFLILDSIAPAFRPDEASVDELVTMLRDADFSVSYGCGLGFTVATSDQRVALFVAPANSSSPPIPPVSFPNDEWYGEVQIGKDLMANHCNDVIELWKPQPVVVARWPLASGLLEFEPLDANSACGGIPVTATLSGVGVDTPLGQVTVGDLDLLNDAYGCFAG